MKIEDIPFVVKLGSKLFHCQCRDNNPNMKIISIKVGGGWGGGGRSVGGGGGWAGIYFNFTENDQLDKSNSDSNKSTDVSGLNFKELLLKHNLI